MVGIEQFLKTFFNPAILISGVIVVGLTIFALWLIHGGGKSSSKKSQQKNKLSS